MKNYFKDKLFTVTFHFPPFFEEEKEEILKNWAHVMERKRIKRKDENKIIV